MSPRLARLNPSQVIRVIEKLGFSLVRQSGSHKIYKNARGIRVTIPFHKGKILHPKIIKSIMKDAEIDTKALQDLL